VGCILEQLKGRCVSRITLPTALYLMSHMTSGWWETIKGWRPDWCVPSPETQALLKQLRDWNVLALDSLRGVFEVRS
jgi:hypothetical protein